MSDSTSDSRLSQTLERVDIIHWWHFSFIVFAAVLEALSGQLGLMFIPKIIVILLVYKLFFKIKERLYYSFWTFSVIIMLIFLFSLKDAIYAHHSFMQSACYLFASVLLGLEMYILSSPIYYPIVPWWHYDFRYRDDIKIKALVNEKELVGRLTDPRRGAGCVSLFEDLHIGTIFTLSADGIESNGPIKGEIMSRRQYSLGRPHDYGVRFHLSTSKERDVYNSLISRWRSRKSLI